MAGLIVTVDVRMLHASGIGTYLKNLLPKVVKSLTDVHFALVGDKDELAKYDWTCRGNVSIVESRCPIYSLAEQWELWRRIPLESSLFWAPHYNIPVFFRGKLLVTVHDVFHLAMPQYAGGWHKHLYALGMFSMVSRSASAILCVSKFTMQELEKHTRVRRSRVFPVYNGIDEGWFGIAEGPRPHQHPYILYVGNVKPHKNLSGLLEGFMSIRDRIPHDLVVVGRKEGLITPDRNAVTRSRELRGRVRFTGYIGEDLIKQYTLHADCLVLPSYYEGFGFPPLEAMACGTPVVVSNIPALVETCGEAALFCDPSCPQDIAAKILNVIEDGCLRSDLRRKGIERARQFRWDRCALATSMVIRELLNEG